MRRLASARAVRRFTPATCRKPLVAGNKPHSMRKVVVLPAPFGPSKPNISPRLTAKEVLFTAMKSPNLRTRSRTSIITSSLVSLNAPCALAELLESEAAAASEASTAALS